MKWELEGAAANSASFGAQWKINKDGTRIWGQTIDFRRRQMLRELMLTPQELDGKRVLDVGCGLGQTSALFAEMGAMVTAMDVAASFHSKMLKPNVYFVLGDVMDPPFEKKWFDVVYAGGVLHHTPDTKAAFDKVWPLVAPGGRLFVWVYHAIDSPVYRLKCRLRHGPLAWRRALAGAFAVQARMRHQEMSLREHYLVQHDFFTPRWRWEHTPAEVIHWFEKAGFDFVLVTSHGTDGFGVLGEFE